MAFDVCNSARQLAFDLEKLEGTAFPGSQVRDMFNVIVKTGKEQVPDNPLIQAIQEMPEPAMSGAACQSNAATLKAALVQIADATDPDLP